MAREREPDGHPPDAAPTADGEAEACLEAVRVIRCRRCSTHVTDTASATAVDGKHAHDFVNPAGIPFRIRCFATAIGASGWGDTSSFFSWFPGHTWRIAVCASCGVHIGWVFEKPASPAHAAFFGLIVERIVEA